MTAIECSALTKRFGDLLAVDHLTFSVEENEIFGLLGPNGAGKTTTIKVLTTLIPPTSGSVEVMGHDVKDGVSVRKLIGVVRQEIAMDIFLSLYDNMDIYGRIHGMPKKERKERIENLLEALDLQDKRDAKIETLSGGLMRRAQIARSFMHRPEILFLDEPTTGLDPRARRSVWDFIKDAASQGTTVILTTHYMEEADYLCDRIGIMDHGRIIALGTPDELKNGMGGGDIVELTVEGDPLELSAEVSKLEYVKKASAAEGIIKMQVDNADIILSDLTQYVIERGRKIRGISVIRNVSIRKPSLEDVFLSLTGKRMVPKKET